MLVSYLNSYQPDLVRTETTFDQYDSQGMGRPVKQLKRKTDTREAALGAAITELRVKKGLGYEEVAHKVGCNPGYMSDIERGRQKSFSQDHPGHC